jgi:protein SCO1
MIERNWKRRKHGIVTGRLVGCLVVVLCLTLPLGILAHTEHPETFGSGTLKGQENSRVENQVAGVEWIREKTGDFLPLDTKFVDAAGKNVPLRALIDRPTLILPIYYFCPNSCSLDLSRLASALKASTFKPGLDFNIIAFSFNADETADAARNAKITYLNQLPDDFPADAWAFLIGTRESIDALTDALGYTYKKMADGSFVHPSALVAVATDGRIIKYVYGSFPPGDIDMALLEATKGTPSISIKRLLGYCFNNDPQKSLAFLQNVKVWVLLGFAVMGGIFVVFLRRDGKKRDGGGERHGQPDE